MKIIFRISTDFGHGDYIKRFTTEALKGASASLPDEPVTPTVKSLTLSYSATANVDLSLSDHRKLYRTERILLPYHPLWPCGTASFLHWDLRRQCHSYSLIPMKENYILA